MSLLRLTKAQLVELLQQAQAKMADLGNDPESALMGSAQMGLSHTSLQKVFSVATHICVITTDLKGTVTLFNPAAEKLLGYQVEEVVGKMSATAFHLTAELEQRSRELSLELGKTVEGFGVFTEYPGKGSPEEREWTYVRKDGSHLAVKLVVTPIYNQNDEVEGFLGLATDISSLKRSERKLRKTREELERKVIERTEDLRALNQSLEEEIARRLQAQEELRQSEENYRTLVNNLNIGVYRTTPGGGGTFLQANPALAEMLGYDTVAELAQSKVIDCYMDVGQRQEFILEVAERGKVFRRELHLKQKDGTPFWAACTASVRRNQKGETICFDGVLEDITRQKEAEQALRESEKRYRALVENAHEGVCVVQDGIIRFANRRAAEIMGLSRGDLISRSFWDFIHPKDRTKISPRLVSKGEVSAGTKAHICRLTDASGITRWVEVASIPITWEGAAVSLNFVNDITGRRLAYEALRKSQASLARAQKLARLGNWEFDYDERSFTCSLETFALFGVPAYEGFICLEDFLRIVHRSDVDLVMDTIEKAPKMAGVVSLEHRIVKPGGEVRVVNEMAEVEREENGRPLKLVGAVQDITEMRRSEERMRLLARVFENTIEGIMVTDTQGLIRMVNKGFIAITGYSIEEILGQSYEVLKTERHESGFYRSMWRSLRKTDHWQGEIWNRRRNGEPYPAWLTITAIKDAQDRVSHYVGVFHDITEAKRSEERITYQAYHDALTGLPNRLLFNDRLNVAMAHAQRSRQGLAVLFLDLDSFKNINDTLGHAVGDLLLMSVARRLMRWVREEDTVARLGGDEFIMLLQGTDDPDYIVQVAQRILDSLAAPFLVREHELYVTASIGITLYPHDGLDLETLVSNADVAMYKAKEQGRNSFKLFTPSMNAQVVERVRLEGKLRKAMERNEFFVLFQPRINLDTGRMVGVEALVRWQPEPGEVVKPDFFVTVAEESGLIVPLGEWVMKQACKAARSWLEMGFTNLQVSVNLSPRQFQQKNLVKTISAILDSTCLPPSTLELEVTESAVMLSVDDASVTLAQLSKLGVSLSLDDFGRGYSSLYYLKRFPMESLKIDRSFVRDLDKDPDFASIVKTIISMSRSLNLKVVAEGVETKAQLDFLKANHCDEMQGYFFSPPVTFEQITAFLKEDKRLS